MMLNNNLVGGFNPSEKYELVSWDLINPNMWKNKNVPNHQPAIQIHLIDLIHFVALMKSAPTKSHFVTISINQPG